MGNTQIIHQIKRIYGKMPHPDIIVNDIDDNSYEANSIRKDFGYLEPDKMDALQCSMMIIDSSLITDATLLYFLSALVELTIENNGHYDLLYRRLERVDKDKLTIEQSNVINEIIVYLKNCEVELET